MMRNITMDITHIVHCLNSLVSPAKGHATVESQRLLAVDRYSQDPNRCFGLGTQPK